MFLSSAAFFISRCCGGGSRRWFSLGAKFTPWPIIENWEGPAARISRVPRLMLCSPTAPTIRYLYELEDKKDGGSTALKLGREISVPEIAGRHCIGSSHGFVFAQVPRRFDQVILGVNPVSGDKLLLPPVPGDAPADPTYERSLIADIHSKVTLSPSLDIAILICRTSWSDGFAYFARLKPVMDEDWTLIPSPVTVFDDCAFHAGRFISVNSNGAFTTFNHSADPSKPRALIHSSNIRRGDVWIRCRRYLVESPDGKDLFLVSRELNKEEAEERQQQTRRFHVLRLDKNDRYMWKPVDRLGGLAFFVGHVNCFSLPAADFPCLKPDSIYFTADVRPGDSDLPIGRGGLSDTGVFDLQDGTIHFFQLPDARDGVKWLPPTWVAPADMLTRHRYSPSAEAKMAKNIMQLQRSAFPEAYG